MTSGQIAIPAEGLTALHSGLYESNQFCDRSSFAGERDVNLPNGSGVLDHLASVLTTPDVTANPGDDVTCPEPLLSNSPPTPPVEISRNYNADKLSIPSVTNCITLATPKRVLDTPNTTEYDATPPHPTFQHSTPILPSLDPVTAGLGLSEEDLCPTPPPATRSTSGQRDEASPPPPPPPRTTKKTCTYVDGVCNLHGPAKRTWKPVRVRTRGPDGRSRTVVNREYSWKCGLLPGQTKLSFPTARTTRGTQERDTRLQGEQLDASEGQGVIVLRAGFNLDQNENTDRQDGHATTSGDV